MGLKIPGTCQRGIRLDPYVLLLLMGSGLFGSVVSLAAPIPPDRLPPGGMFQAGIPKGIPSNYEKFCDVTVSIPGSGLLAKGDGVSDDSAAINAALDLCPNRHFVFIPAGTYRISGTIQFPARAVVLRGAGSQGDVKRTNLLCYGIGRAIYMNGKMRFGGVIENLRSGYVAGSSRLKFSSFMDSSGLSVGDILLVTEDYDPISGPTLGGNLESSVGRFPESSFRWNPSKSASGAFYVSAADGTDPRLAAAKVHQVFFSPSAGTENILKPARKFPIAPGEWVFADADSLGFRTLYVSLPENIDPRSLSKPGTDGVPDGGVWYNPGISWGGVYLSAKGFYAHEGQAFRITGITGATVNLDRPFYWTHKENGIAAIAYRAGASGMGLEDMCIRVMQAHPQTDAVVVQSTEDSWIRNVEVNNSANNFIVASGTIDCEFRHNYVHEPWNAQGGSGYGIRLIGWNCNDLVEDNIAYSCRHSYVIDGINTGHVIGYNFSLDPNDNTNGILHPARNHGYLYQDFLTHGSSPRFCLYEGNVGARAYCDFVHGSANNLIYFRNRFRLQEGHILAFGPGAAAVNFDRWNNNMSVVGNILGYPAMQSEMGQYPMTYEGHVRAIYRLGYNANDNQKIVCDDRPKASLFRHGNYDYVNNAVVWDPATPDHHLPASLYLGAKPPWFGEMRWPPVDPERAPQLESSSLEAIIPAMRRFGELSREAE
jgi:pectate lyase-like protein